MSDRDARRLVDAFDGLGMINVLLAGLVFSALASGVSSVLRLDVEAVLSAAAVATLAFALLTTRLDRDRWRDAAASLGEGVEADGR